MGSASGVPRGWVFGMGLFYNGLQILGFFDSRGFTVF
jgi:hypothetical protein